jgi:hypothetical protein
VASKASSVPKPPEQRIQERIRNEPETRTAKKTIPAKGAYLGLMAGPVFNNYNIKNTDSANAGIYHIDGKGAVNGGMYFGIDFGLLAAQAEVLITGDNAEMELSYFDSHITGTSLLVPLILKLDFHLGPFILQPLAGPYLNFALGDIRSTDEYDGRNYDPYANPLFGLMFGGTVGIRMGRGMIFVDTRYAKDLGKAKAGNHPMTIWEHSALRLNAGYQFNFGR